MSRALAIIIILLSANLAACSPSASRGPIPSVAADGIKVSTSGATVANLFYDDLTKSHTDPTNHQKALQMLKSGTDTVAVYCDEFFKTAGNEQKWLIFSRDLIGVVGTLATAVVSLHPGGKNAAANIAFATGAGFSGLDIYTKTFLFGADNVDSVWTLTMNALDLHKKTTIAKFGDSLEFSSAMVLILENQKYCTSMSILGMARDAIKNGKLTAATSSSEDLSPVIAKVDLDALTKLGALFGRPGPLSIKQATMLYWLYLYSVPDKTTIASTILPILSDLNPAVVDASGSSVASAPLISGIQDALQRLQPATQKSIQLAIDDAIADAATKAKAAAAQAKAIGAPPAAAAPISAPSSPIVTQGLSITPKVTIMVK